MSKILVLGGKPIGSVELVKRLKELGHYVIVTDYLTKEQSPAKLYADETWDISTAEVNVLTKKCEQQNVDAVLTAVHEFNINRMLDICEKLKLPCYCNRDTWIYCDNKIAFKNLCINNNITVAKKYNINIKESNSLENINYPVIAKPVDGSGSRGFSICKNETELIQGYEKALEFSPTKQVIVEDYIPYNAVIIHYTMINGKCYYSGMSDKISCKFATTGASVMGFQSFPSKGEKQYISKVDEKARKMFENAGFINGPIWIEAFYDGKDSFIFNEMGYRFGGSLTNYPVKYYYGIDQLDMMIESSLGISSVCKPNKQNIDNHYCILPVHIKAGKINKINGINEILKKDYLNAFVQVHFKGDEIKDWGSAQQVFCYLHFIYINYSDLYEKISEVMIQLKVLDDNGENLLYTLFDIELLKSME